MRYAETEKKHLLVVSDEPRILAEVKKELISKFEISIAATSAAALNALQGYSISLIAINIGKNRKNAFAINEDIKQYAKDKGIPVMFLAENGNGSDEVEAFKAGAVDYAIRQPETVDALIQRIELRILASEASMLLSKGAVEAESLANDPEKALYGKTILVVDDVEINREIVEGMLSGIRGLSVEFAKDGLEAVELYAQKPDRYALILMDINMPVMSGTESVKTIRQLAFASARQVPIIALTAGVEDEETSSYLAAGMNDFLEKPMDFDQLYRIVTKYIK